MRSVLLNGYKVSFWGSENILELDRGIVCTLCECTKCHQIVRFKMIKMVNSTIILKGQQNRNQKRGGWSWTDLGLSLGSTIYLICEFTHVI